MVTEKVIQVISPSQSHDDQGYKVLPEINFIVSHTVGGQSCRGSILFCQYPGRLSLLRTWNKASRLETCSGKSENSAIHLLHRFAPVNTILGLNRFAAMVPIVDSGHQ
jgi:hypothetical protein